jgi:hypothetical protein
MDILLTLLYLVVIYFSLKLSAVRKRLFPARKTEIENMNSVGVVRYFDNGSIRVCLGKAKTPLESVRSEPPFIIETHWSFIGHKESEFYQELRLATMLEV